MKFQIIFQTSRKVTIEFLDFGIYFTEKKYRLLLNGKEILNFRSGSSDHFRSDA